MVSTVCNTLHNNERKGATLVPKVLNSSTTKKLESMEIQEGCRIGPVLIVYVLVSRMKANIQIQPNCAQMLPLCTWILRINVAHKCCTQMLRTNVVHKCCNIAHKCCTQMLCTNVATLHTNVATLHTNVATLHTHIAHKCCTQMLRTNVAHKCCHFAHKCCTQMLCTNVATLHTNVAHKCCTQMLHTNVAHKCCAQMLHTNVAHECCTQMLRTNVATLHTHSTLFFFRPDHLPPQFPLWSWCAAQPPGNLVSAMSRARALHSESELWCVCVFACTRLYMCVRACVHACRRLYAF